MLGEALLKPGANKEQQSVSKKIKQGSDLLNHSEEDWSLDKDGSMMSSFIF